MVKLCLNTNKITLNGPQLSLLSQNGDEKVGDRARERMKRGRMEDFLCPLFLTCVHAQERVRGTDVRVMEFISVVQERNKERRHGEGKEKKRRRKRKRRTLLPLRAHECTGGEEIRKREVLREKGK